LHLQKKLFAQQAVHQHERFYAPIPKQHHHIAKAFLGKDLKLEVKKEGDATHSKTVNRRFLPTRKHQHMISLHVGLECFWIR